MKAKSILATLLLLVAGLQTAWGQGFRVYKSDGTVAQFSLRTDSIVFYDGIGTDEDFGPFTPVNQCIVGTWYKSKSEMVTFGEDGTTDYMEGATYKFFPYQGNVVFYNASGAPMSVLKVYELTAEQMIVDTGDHLSVWSRTQPVQLVEFIMLSETSITLQPEETMRLTATVEPADADNPEVTWTSSDDAVATVINNGLVVAVADGTCTITCSATDGSGVKAECQVTVGGVTPDEHEYVDLGLPSGTLWATCNVGASSPEEYGDYFAWGETAPKDYFEGSTYFDTDDDGDTFKKYNNNGGLTELLPEDDAATKNWGSPWHMPTYEQIEELLDNCTREWTTQGGVNGTLVTGPNGNTIFLPAAGRRWDGGLYHAGSYGGSWSSSLLAGGSRACYLYFDSGGWDWYYYGRYYGQSVRAVRP